jgi:hypothetical protein
MYVAICIWIQNVKSIRTYTPESNGLIRLNLSNSFDLPIIKFGKLHFHIYHGVCYAGSPRETICYKLSLSTTLLLKRNSMREDITMVILLITEQEQSP